MKDPIFIIEHKGYKILEYENGLRIASGIGISGEIIFVPGRVSPCDFKKRAPDGKGWISGESGKGSFYRWRDEHGVVHVCPEEKCCCGVLQHAQATACITARLSTINSGSKLKGYFQPKDKDGNISTEALYLALLIAPEKPEFIRDDLITALNNHPRQKFKFVDNWDGDAVWSGSAYNNFLRFAEPWFMLCLRVGGSSALLQAANLLEKIETKTRQLEKSEEDFLDAVSKAATKIFAVPTQKEVRDIWIEQQAGRNDKNFCDVRDRLAFSWLPTAKRGKNAHGRKG
jgi:hypothetical protein